MEQLHGLFICFAASTRRMGSAIAPWRRAQTHAARNAPSMTSWASALACSGLLQATAAMAFAHAEQKADRVVIKKSESRLYLEKSGKVFRSFGVVFGANPEGHKERQGDERTPEGRYLVDSKNASSAFHKSMHISYPNTRDTASARVRGVDPGGLIMVHGQKNGFGWLSPLMQWFNWTDGCIALSNSDMDIVWNAVDVGTPIQIDP